MREPSPSDRQIEKLCEISEGWRKILMLPKGWWWSNRPDDARTQAILLPAIWKDIRDRGIRDE